MLTGLLITFSQHITSNEENNICFTTVPLLWFKFMDEALPV